MQHLLRLKYCRLATLSLLLCLSFIGLVHSTENQCEKKRPHSSTSPCNGESERRYFLHDTKGCKKFGICSEDALVYDNETGNNYFLSWGDCQRTCMESIECPPVEAPMNGIITMDEYSGWGGSIYYDCHVGFSLVGSSKRTCQKNQTWTGDSAPYCQAQCKRPPVTANVKSIAPVQDYYNVGTVIYYTCADGYTGSTQRTCMDDGTWSGQDAECAEMEEIQCKGPSPIDYGTVVAPDHSVGAYLTYSCEAKFILSGNATRRCMEDGEWEGEEPTCWKLGLQKSFNGETEDVTNQTVSYPIRTRNIVFEIVSTNNIHSLEGYDIEWSFVNSRGSAEWPEGVDNNLNSIEFKSILTSREQEGKYIARVGNFTVYFLLSISETSPSMPVIPLQFLTIRSTGNMVSNTIATATLGSDTTITCIFQGCPEPSVTWLYEDKPVEFNDKFESSDFSSHSSTPILISDLKIKTLSFSDTGYYTCVAGNEFQNANSSLRLEVLEPPQAEVEPSQEKEKRSVGSSRSPLCSSSSSSPSHSSTVTIVGRVQRNIRMRRSPHMTSYQIRVDRVLNGATDSLERDQTLRTIIVDSSVEYPARLKRNSDYILRGNVMKDMFYVSGYEFVQSHSNELESSLLQC